MTKIIAHCGITCSDCPTFIATKTNDDAERNKVAELWTKQYGHPFKPEDINCDGCQTKGTGVFNYTKICEIRKCGQERDIENGSVNSPSADFRCKLSSAVKFAVREESWNTHQSFYL